VRNQVLRHVFLLGLFVIVVIMGIMGIMGIMILPFNDIQGIRLDPVARVKTPDGAIFYTLVQHEGVGDPPTFEAFYRHRYDGRVLGKCIIDPDTWAITHDSGPVCPGEDPRSFSHRGTDYLIDNSWGASCLIVPKDDFKRCLLPSKGKNLLLVSHGDSLLCIEWLEPLNVLETTETPYPDTWRRIKKGREASDFSFRGGTPGYTTTAKGVYIGFGHRTTLVNGVVAHTPFAWRLLVDDENGPSIQITPVKGRFDRVITDPTCVISHRGRFFLVTAESHMPWFGGMHEFFTCIYEIQFQE
jgi:hypothetical protein